MFCQQISLFVYKKANACFGLRTLTDKYLHGVIYSDAKIIESPSPNDRKIGEFDYFVCFVCASKTNSNHFDWILCFGSYFQTNSIHCMDFSLLIYIYLLLFRIISINIEWMAKSILRSMIASTHFRTLILNLKEKKKKRKKTKMKINLVFDLLIDLFICACHQSQSKL